jgi:hypothetical protein
MRSRLLPVLPRLGPLTLGLALLSGCGLLDTNQPDIIQPGNLDSPQGAEARRLGAIRDFAFAKDGDGSQDSTEGLVLLSGDMADEFGHSGFIPSTVEFDQRLVVNNNPSLTDQYYRLHRARTAAESAAEALQQFSLDPDNDAGIAEMSSLAGFTYIYFGETFCSAVPYSSVSGDETVFGPSESTAATLQRAVARFDAALAHPGVAADANVGYLAAVGKGRALLDLGQFTEAAQAVQGVPTEFQYLSEHDPTPLTLANAIFVYAVSGPVAGGSISVADVEGGNGLPFRSANDPRVPFTDTGHLGLDQTTPQFDLLKYPDEAAPIVVADGIEARLIEAEALLQVGDRPGMTAILNDLRANAISPPLPALPVPGSAAAAEDVLFSERAFWLYATGHRLGDMRRLVRQYGRSVDTVFPVGGYLRGGSYGTLVSFPVPLDEQNNPQFDRSACDPTTP